MKSTHLISFFLFLFVTSFSSLFSQNEIKVPVLNGKTVMMYIDAGKAPDIIIYIEDGIDNSLKFEVKISKEKIQEDRFHLTANTMNQLKDQGYKLVGITSTTYSYNYYYFQKD